MMFRIVLFILCCPLSAWAQFSLTTLNSLRLPLVEFTVPNSNRIDFGTDGSIIYTNSFSGSPFGVPGRVQITGDVGDVLEIACRGQVRLSNTSTNTRLNLNIEIAMAPGTIFRGPGSADCAGQNNVVLTHTISANSAENVVHIGGRFATGNSSFTITSDVFSSSLGSQSRPGRLRINVQ